MPYINSDGATYCGSCSKSDDEVSMTYSIFYDGYYCLDCLFENDIAKEQEEDYREECEEDYDFN